MTKTKYNVELTNLAQQQIMQIAEYIRDELKTPETAKRTVAGIEEKLRRLETMPERVVLIEMEPWHSKGVHKYIMGQYIAYFIIAEPEGIVRVMAVVLYRRDQKKQLEQIKP